MLKFLTCIGREIKLQWNSVLKIIKHTILFEREVVLSSADLSRQALDKECVKILIFWKFWLSFWFWAPLQSEAKFDFGSKIIKIRIKDNFRIRAHSYLISYSFLQIISLKLWGLPLQSSCMRFSLFKNLQNTNQQIND